MDLRFFETVLKAKKSQNEDYLLRRDRVSSSKYDQF